MTSKGGPRGAGAGGGVLCQPFLFLTLGLPCFLTTSGLKSIAQPVNRSIRYRTLAPAASSALIASSYPPRAARCRGVSSAPSLASSQQPRPASSEMQAAWPPAAHALKRMHSYGLPAWPVGGSLEPHDCLLLSQLLTTDKIVSLWWRLCEHMPACVGIRARWHATLGQQQKARGLVMGH